MKVDIHQHGSVTVVVPRGAICEPETADLQQALSVELKKSGPRLVIDMTHVPCVDSAGIELLLGVAAAAPSAGLRPRVAALTETVRDCLDLTNTLDRFYRFDTVESAVRSYL